MYTINKSVIRSITIYSVSFWNVGTYKATINIYDQYFYLTNAKRY